MVGCGRAVDGKLWTVGCGPNRFASKISRGTVLFVDGIVILDTRSQHHGYSAN
jgi:hypothetical protein